MYGGERHLQLETSNGEIIYNVEWEDILRLIDDLGSREEHIILSDAAIPYDEIPSGDFAYIQVAYNTPSIFSRKRKSFCIETRKIDSKASGGFWHFRFETADKAEVVEIFKNWFNGQNPDLGIWEDVTDEMTPF